MALELRSVSDLRAAAEIRAALSELRSGARLQAAHHRELIPDGVPAPLPVRAALGAAVSGGFALGLEQAWEIVAEVLGAEPHTSAERRHRKKSVGG